MTTMTLEQALEILDPVNTSAFISRDRDGSPEVIVVGTGAVVSIDGNFNIEQLKALITVIESKQ